MSERARAPGAGAVVGDAPGGSNGATPDASNGAAPGASNGTAPGASNGAVPDTCGAVPGTSGSAVHDTSGGAVEVSDCAVHDEFREYVVARGPILLRMAHQLCGNPADAEDLLQAALIKTYLSWHRINDRAALDGYVRRAMVNINISWWRRRKLEEYPSEEVPESATGDAAAYGAVYELLDQALDRLPTRQRTAIMLRYFEDMTEPEIAQTLGISIGTVKSTVSRAMAKLRGDLVLAGRPQP